GPHPARLPQEADGERPAETLRNAPLPRERGRVGVGGRRTARIIPPAAAPRPHPGLPPQAGEGEMPAETLRNDLPPPRAGEGWGRRTPSTPLAAWTLRAHVTPVPHRGDEDGANATGASPCPTCP